MSKQAPITPTTQDVDALYQELLGRSGDGSYLKNWAQSGLSIEEIRSGIAGSPEGQAYANRPPPPAEQPIASVNQAIQQATTTAGGSQSVSRERLDQLYNELFGRTTGARDEGAEYWMASGLTGEALRDALIAGAQGSDAVKFQSDQQALAQLPYAQRASDIDQMYRELFGRPAEQAGLEYWLSTGLAGEALRDQLVAAASSQAEDSTDRQGFINRQTALATGQTPEGYKTYSPAGPPGYFTDLQDEFTAMQEEIAALNVLLANQQSGGGSSSVGSVGVPGGVSVGQPGGGTTTTDSGSSYAMPTVAPPMDNPYLAQLPTNPPVGYIPPTPEMLDAYRYEQFYNQGMVPPVDQGIGGLSYFGIPPSQIQASLTGF